MISEIVEKIHEYKDSSSDSDDEKSSFFDLVKKKKRLFGRKESVHSILGGGKYADIILWRDMQVSGSIFAGVTVIWFLFEWIGYHLITFICHFLILSLAILFIWSSASSFFGKAPPNIPDVILSDELFLITTHSIKAQINEAFATYHSIASGNDLKIFLKVIAGLWILSIIGNWFSFLTFFYLVFVIMYCAPVFYEKYEDQVDSATEKAMVQIRKQYALIDGKLLQKIPRCPFSSKKNN